MNRSILRKFGSLSRIIALITSAVAAVLFVAFFATESYFQDGLDRYLTGKDSNPALASLLALFITFFLGYLLACKRKLAEIGGALSVVCVVALFVLCQNTIALTLSPLVLALAAPAVMHLASVVFFRAVEENRETTPTKPKADRKMPAPLVEDDSQFSEHELAVGAA